MDPASIHDHDTEGVSLLLGRVLLNAVLNIKVHTVPLGWFKYSIIVTRYLSLSMFTNGRLFNETDGPGLDYKL